VDRNEFSARVRDQFRDLIWALIIILKETIFALAVLAASRGIAWCIHAFTSDGEMTAVVVRHIGDFGAILLFIMLIGRDLVDYYRRK